MNEVGETESDRREESLRRPWQTPFVILSALSNTDAKLITAPESASPAQFSFHS